MRVVSLNLRHGGGARIPSICQYIESLEPDIFVASEHRQGTALSTELIELGLRTQVAGIGKKNSVLVAAKIDGQPITHDPQRLIGLQFGWFSVLGTYFPQKHEKRRLFQYLLGNPPSDRTLLIGDFNTGEHFKDEHGKTFYCADLFARLTEVGWDRINPHEPSWLSAAGNGFCIDHAFIWGGLSGTATYDHVTRDQGISDHSALIVELDDLPAP
jgi:exonuclease III